MAAQAESRCRVLLSAAFEGNLEMNKAQGDV